ncbi:MAG: ATP-binding protein [Myxococcaceae bacterium]|nr:ATP-binding protein [Myxococcaceae bacterium]
MTSLSLGVATDGTPLTLDPKALTTHGFVLGMTGSGKTGLCAVLVEELLAQGIPVIAVDSKGDLGTLLLRFDAMDTTSLAQWTTDAGAAAAQLANALAQSGRALDQDAAVRASYEARLYTPGSTVGLPLDLLGTLAPPAQGDTDAINGAADGVARSLLGLLGVEIDPLTSREYLLLVQLLTTAWQQGQTPTLVDLVRQVNQPPFAVVGALPLEDFFPQRERQGLMIRLNGLIASPKFQAWRTGDPLDPEVLLRAPDGRPRLSIYSVAHLPDEERLAVVALLLERLQGWMRRQGGSNALRAVLLIDEIFGYFPPSPANPPTKPPLIGLLKQARAFGVSVVLATQNPIDLDYRGLANIGTWLVGRLQTEQDKARIRDALVAAATATGVTASELETQIAQLQPRQFLLHSVHRPKPSILKTRDALTILRGPFSEDELRAVTAPMKAQVGAARVDAGGGGSAGAAPTAVGPGAAGGAAAAAVAGAVATGAVGAPTAAPGVGGAGASLTPPLVGLEPELGPIYEVDRGVAQLFLLLKFGVRYRVGTAASEETIHELAFPTEQALTPGEVLEHAPFSVNGVPFQATPPPGVTFAATPSWVQSLKLVKLQGAIKERLPSKLETKLLVDPTTKLISGPTESLEAFTARVVAKEAVAKTSQTLLRTLERKRADLAQMEREITSRKAQKWLDVGAGVLGLFGGRRSTLSAASRAVSSHRMQGGAEAKLEDLQVEVRQLEAQVAATKDVDPRRFTEQLVVPRASDVQILRLCWAFIVP